MTLAARLRAGEALVGAWLGSGAQAAAELLGSSGVDYVVVDLQHGYATERDLPALFAAIEARGAAPLVRLGSHERREIGRVLDLGAHGIIVPEVHDAVQARAVVAATSLPPRGNRGFGPMRAAVSRGAAWQDVAVILQIESRDGLDAVAEIAAVEGVVALLVGPWDLSLSLGLPVPPNLEHPALAEALRRVREAADAAGLAAGVHTLDGASAARFLAGGWRIANAVDDLTLLRGAAAEAARARGHA